ncbi:hypothetical protein PFISCL1PPCAC_22495, partial [Pristionchus fissidentatus]
TGKYTTLLIFESVVGMLVALSNIMIIFILIAGWKRLMKNTFYIIVFNLIVCTSMKAVVELAFVVPYYIMRGEKEAQLKLYYNHCERTTAALTVLLNVLIYLTYGCTVFVLVLEAGRDVTRSNRSSVEMKLLRQSIVIFTLYAGSIFTVLLLSFVDPGKGIFDLAYAENLLNLSIAAVYPICFLAMSGEMK